MSVSSRGKFGSWAALSAGGACSVGTAVGVGTILLGTFPLFLAPISEEFGWGRTVLTGALSVAGLTQMFASPLWGRALDRFGTRAIALPGIILTGLMLMLLSRINGSVTQLYILFSMLAILSGAAGGVAYPKVISAWFKNRRGLALGVFLGGAFGIALTILVPLTGHLIQVGGWRRAYVILGLLPIAVGFPVFVLWLREPGGARRPAGRERAVSKSAEEYIGISSRQVLATRDFWFLTGALFLNSLAIGGFRAHAVVLLTDHGYSGGFAAFMLSSMAISMVAGQIGVGFVLDRFRTPRVGIPIFLAAFLGLVALNFTTAPQAIVIIGAAVLGLATGAEHSVGPYFTSRFFGLRSFAEIQGYMTMATGAGYSISPVLVAFMFEKSGSYQGALIVLDAALAISALAVAFLGPYQYSATSAHKGDQGTASSVAIHS
jgi:MFS family permease